MAERLTVNQDVEGSSPSPGAMASLPDDEIVRRVATLDGWEHRGDEIAKTFELPTFPDAIAFVTRVAERAEAAGHHPDLDIRYTKVRVVLSTHSEGGITEKDFALAAQIEATAG